MTSKNEEGNWLFLHQDPSNVRSRKQLLAEYGGPMVESAYDGAPVPAKSYRCIAGAHQPICPGAFKTRPDCICPCHMQEKEDWSTMDAKKWFVLGPEGLDRGDGGGTGGTVPRKYDSKDDAVSRASKLASNNKEATYVILEAIATVSTPTPPAEIKDLS